MAYEKKQTIRIGMQMTCTTCRESICFVDWDFQTYGLRSAHYTNRTRLVLKNQKKKKKKKKKHVRVIKHKTPIDIGKYFVKYRYIHIHIYIIYIYGHRARKTGLNNKFFDI